MEIEKRKKLWFDVEFYNSKKNQPETYFVRWLLWFDVGHMKVCTLKHSHNSSSEIKVLFFARICNLTPKLCCVTAVALHLPVFLYLCMRFGNDVSRSDTNMKTGFALLCTFLIVACSPPHARRNDLSPYAGKDTLAVLMNKWNHYNKMNYQDSIVQTASPVFYRSIAAHDTVAIQHAGVFMAQAFLLRDMSSDSTRSFIEQLKPFFSRGPHPNIAAVYYNIMGHWALKYELDYSEALSNYLKAYECAKEAGHVNNQIVMLCNIVNIFYVREDDHGAKYAEDALLLAESEKANAFYKIAANIAAAQVRYLSSETGESMAFLQKAHAITLEENVAYWFPVISMLYGDLYRTAGDFDRAKEHYTEALAQTTPNTEPSTVSQIYLNFGRLYEDMGDKKNAIALYMKGLDVTDETNNMEFRKELLKRVAALWYDLGHKTQAADCYREYISFLDSLQVERKNRDFGKIQLAYAEMRHKWEMTEQELELSKSQHRLFVFIFVFAIVALLASAVSVLYIRQRKNYRELIRRYDEYYRRLISENRKQDILLETDAGADAEPNRLYETLYLKMENLMREGAFRQKDLSLEKMAAMTGSNRTYVSNAINKRRTPLFIIT